MTQRDYLKPARKIIAGLRRKDEEQFIQEAFFDFVTGLLYFLVFVDFLRQADCAYDCSDLD